MIVAEQKPLAEIKTLIGDANQVLVVGCGTCVTVCFAGGSLESGDCRRIPAHGNQTGWKWEAGL